MSNGFDRLATPYRWMEYLTFGRTLEQCRCFLLAQVTDSRRALLLGDGDGRFAERLLHAAPAVHITAVDFSPAMLTALQVRCAAPQRVTAVCLDLASMPVDFHAGPSFDLVISHFFLDCLTEPQIERLLQTVKPCMTPHARWIVSEFNIPQDAMRVPAYVLVRTLYFAFRVLAGLRVQRLPEYGRILRANGFTRTTRKTLLHGLLIAEEWQLLQPGEMVMNEA